MSDQTGDRVELDEEQWRERLTPEQYAIGRGKGTEPPFTGCTGDEKTQGTVRPHRRRDMTAEFQR